MEADIEGSDGHRLLDPGEEPGQLGRDPHAAALQPNQHDTVGAVVSMTSVPAGLVTAPLSVVALPAVSVTVAVPRLTAVTVRSDVFCPAATV